MSFLMICEILLLFVNTLTADDKYSLLIGTTYHYQFKCNYLENKKNDSPILAQFLKSTSNFEYFEKR